MSSRCVTSWTVIPDCSAPDSVPAWHATELSEPHARILVSLYEAQPHAIDAARRKAAEEKRQADPEAGDDPRQPHLF